MQPTGSNMIFWRVKLQPTQVADTLKIPLRQEKNISVSREKVKTISFTPANRQQGSGAE